MKKLRVLRTEDGVYVAEIIETVLTVVEQSVIDDPSDKMNIKILPGGYADLDFSGDSSVVDIVYDAIGGKRDQSN